MGSDEKIFKVNTLRKEIYIGNKSQKAKTVYNDIGGLTYFGIIKIKNPRNKRTRQPNNTK